MENINVTEQSTNEIMPMAASGETNFASLPEKATPASGDMFLMEDSEDTKKINYDKLADAILNKLTSKTYSGLETTAKNFVTAINELNSKILIGANRRYIKVVSNSSSLNWGGILLATGTNILLVSINGANAPKIVWSAISSEKITVNSGENNPLETIIDTGYSQSHTLVIPIGLISKSRIEITD